MQQVSKHLTEKNTDRFKYLEGEIDSNIIKVGDCNTLLSVMGRTSEKKINKKQQSWATL